MARDPHPANPSVPPPGTRERWAWDFVLERELAAKLAPPAPPRAWERDPPARRLAAPGRPSELTVVERAEKVPRPGALTRPRARARLFALFLHHELQAAELFAWAALAFPDTPRAFRRGLFALARAELGHLALYRAELERNGAAVGDFPVRDWFWQRVPQCSSALELVAFLGLGLEGGNLEHARTWSQHLAAAGDPSGAATVARVGREEEAHVRFALRWFERWTGGQDFERWRALLPRPLTPSLLCGRPLEIAGRSRAGLRPPFLQALAGFARAEAAATGGAALARRHALDDDGPRARAPGPEV